MQIVNFLLWSFMMHFHANSFLYAKIISELNDLLFVDLNYTGKVKKIAEMYRDLPTEEVEVWCCGSIESASHEI